MTLDIDFEPLEGRHGPGVMAVFNYYVENGFAVDGDREVF
jgi:hypothetical protein